MVQFRKGPANRIWNVGMFTGTALVPNGMPGGVRGTGNNRPYLSPPLGLLPVAGAKRGGKKGETEKERNTRGKKTKNQTVVTGESVVKGKKESTAPGRGVWEGKQTMMEVLSSLATTTRFPP